MPFFCPCLAHPILIRNTTRKSKSQYCNALYHVVIYVYIHILWGIGVSESQRTGKLSTFNIRWEMIDFLFVHQFIFTYFLKNFLFIYAILYMDRCCCS